MNFSFSAIMAGFVYGVCGMYLFKHAKRRSNMPNIFIGVALMAYPYFVENEYALWLIGAVLLFAAYRFSKG